MAGTQKNVFGNDGDYHFGPGKLYAQTSVGFVPAGFTGATGTGTDLGKTGPMEFNISSEYIEATSIQTGVKKDDAAVSGQEATISTTLKEAGLDKLALSVDGISVAYDTDSQPIQYGYVNVVGKRKRGSEFQMTFVQLESGLEQWETPFLVIDFFEVVPMSSESTVTFDAENFRELAVMFSAFPSETNLDSNNRQAYFLSRILATE